MTLIITTFTLVHSECHYDECHYAECCNDEKHVAKCRNQAHYAEWSKVECQYTECYYAKCHYNYIECCYTEYYVECCYWGKIGFLPNGHAHIRARVSGTNLCADVHCSRHLFLTQTCFEG
jgi:hypothetical protein